MHWDIGIDLGTENAFIVEEKSGTIKGAAARVAFRDGRDIPICCGDVAERISERTCEGVTVCSPLKDGVLASNLYADRYFRWSYRQCSEIGRGKRYSVVITCAPFCRPVQREALLAAATDAGAIEACLVRSDAIAAIGAGMDLNAPEGKLLVDIGAGKITATVFSMGRAAAFGFLPYGLDSLDQRICRMVRTKKGYRISLKSARAIKHAVCTPVKEGEETSESLSLVGISMADRMPARFELDKACVKEICEDICRQIVQLCTSVVSEAPHGAAADLYDGGAVLTGGGAQLVGIGERISEALGIPCKAADEPTRCGAKGILSFMRTPEKYESVLMGSVFKGSGR